MRHRTTSSAGPEPSSELVGELALRPEDEVRGTILGRDVDRRVLQRRRQLGRHEDAQPVLLGHLVALGRRVGEAEADRDLVGLGRLGKDAQAVRLGNVLSARSSERKVAASWVI